MSKWAANSFQYFTICRVTNAPMAPATEYIGHTKQSVHQSKWPGLRCGQRVPNFYFNNLKHWSLAAFLVFFHH